MPALLPPAAPARDRSASAYGWHWWIPRLALTLFVAALLGSLWALHRQELEENRNGLIRDSLWVEQNIQFSLERDVQQLRQLAEDLPAPQPAAGQLEVRVKHLLSNAPGLVEVALLDATGALRASAPAPLRPEADAPWGALTREPAYRLARSAGNPSYGSPRPVGGDYEFAVFVPSYQGGAYAGMVVGIYGLKPILSGLVPWWLAERHRVTIRDNAGRVLAAKSNVEAEGLVELTHQAPLDPPGHGLLLHVESYGARTNLVRNALVVTILGLAAAVFWSLWALRRHIQRRLDTELALRREHAFRKAMEDSLETGMRAMDLEGRIVYVNPAFCRMVGYSEEELIGHGAPQEYWPPEERANIEEALRASRAAGTPRVPLELELVRRNGDRFDVLIYEAPLVDDQGRHTGWMASVLDITERKRARERVRHQEEKLSSTARLVAMGEMASAIAHELNQPLSAIASYSTGCVNLLRAGTAEPGEIRDALEKTTQQAQRAGRIIRRVHEFVRKSEPSRSRMRLNAVVEEAVGLAEAEARKRRVKIVPQLSPEDAELHADPLLLQQVLLNLVRNGMDAMAETPRDVREITITTERAASSVTVRVADRGCGIAADVQRQLFEPFFTTKAEGMGMGLNICRSILELHQGRVWAEPNPHGGTVFSFSLPVEPT